MDRDFLRSVKEEYKDKVLNDILFGKYCDDRYCLDCVKGNCLSVKNVDDCYLAIYNYIFIQGYGRK